MLQMTRITNFIQDQLNLDADLRGTAISPISLRPRAIGFQVSAESKLVDAKFSQRSKKASQEDFVLFLAEDAQKHPEKLVPFTADMLAEAKALIEGVALD
jgi:hypothetical protein